MSRPQQAMKLDARQRKKGEGEENPRSLCVLRRHFGPERCKGWSLRPLSGFRNFLAIFVSVA